VKGFIHTIYLLPPFIIFSNGIQRKSQDEGLRIEDRWYKKRARPLGDRALKL
jgi:hypothetical protein